MGMPGIARPKGISAFVRALLCSRFPYRCTGGAEAAAAAAGGGSGSGMAWEEPLYPAEELRGACRPVATAVPVHPRVPYICGLVHEEPVLYCCFKGMLGRSQCFYALFHGGRVLHLRI